MKRLILAQTDTTVGFLSQDASRLAKLKERPQTKPFIQSFDTLKRYSTQGGRVPKAFKSELRRAKNSTYIIKNRAIRIVTCSKHHELLHRYGWLYSTSANERAKAFDLDFAKSHVDMIVETKEGLFEGQASKIYKINNQHKKQLR